MAQRGSYAKGLAKREQIISAALEIVAERGYRKATVREIAEAVDLSPAGLLHYFGSREALCIAILEARDLRDSHDADEALDHRDPQRDHTGHGFFATFLEVIAHNATVPGLVQLYVQLAAEAAEPGHPARAFFTQRSRELEGFAIREIETAQRSGSIRQDLDPRWVARALHALADGFQTAWLLDPSIDMSADIKVFIGLLAPPHSS